MKTYINDVLKEFELLPSLTKEHHTWNAKTYHEVRYFIKTKLQQALDQQKEELIEKLEGEKKELEHDDCVVGYEYCECLEWEKHNQVLDRAIEIIKESK